MRKYITASIYSQYIIYSHRMSLTVDVILLEMDARSVALGLFHGGITLDRNNS